MFTYEKIIVASWAIFLLVWSFSAFNIKRDISGGFASAWMQYWWLRIIAAAFLVFVAIRIATGKARFSSPTNSVFSHSIFLPPLVLGWAAALFAVAGVGFAVWARFHLGRNWSPRPAAKERHKLVTSGPYALVRHPIYTGMLFAAFGTALTGTIFRIFALAVAALVFLSRIGKEERIMLELFPNVYPAYQARTKRLIPFIW